MTEGRRLTENMREALAYLKRPGMRAGPRRDGHDGSEIRHLLGELPPKWLRTHTYRALQKRGLITETGAISVAGRAALSEEP